jgi:hypothetical protein
MTFKLFNFTCLVSLGLLLNPESQATLISASPVDSEISAHSVAKPRSHQNQQIDAYINFHQNPSDENQQALQRIFENNINTIMKTIKLRKFSNEDKRLERVLEAKQKAIASFDSNRMNPKKLAQTLAHTYEFLSHQTTSDTYRDDDFSKYDNKYDDIPGVPVCVLSGDGLAKLGRIIDLTSQGFYYIGVPLNESISFDGYATKDHPSFVRHDRIHACILFKKRLGLLPDEANLPEKMKFIKDFTQFLIGETDSLSEKDIKKKRKFMKIISFISIHEGLSSSKINTSWRNKEIFKVLLNDDALSRPGPFFEYALENNLVEVAPDDTPSAQRQKWHMAFVKELKHVKERFEGLP